MTGTPSSNTQFFERPIRHYLKAHPRAFTIGVISLFFTNAFDIMTPLAIKVGLDALTANDPQGLLRAVIYYALLMVGVTVFRFMWRVYFGRFHHSVAEDLRNRIYDKLTILGPSYFNRTPVGSLMSLLTSDVNQFRMAIGPGLLILLDAVFYTAMIIPVMISLSWDWTWKTLLILPLVPFFMRKPETSIHERFREQQDRLSEMSARAQEIVAGIRPIKSFAQEENQSTSFNGLSRRFEDACNRVAKVDLAFEPMMQFSITIGSVILLWVCTPEVMRGAITLGTFVAFHEYIKRMTWPMSAIGSGISMLEQGRASFDRISELLKTETDIPDTGTVTSDALESLEFRDVSFRYPGATKNALTGISFVLRKGETLGLVGPVGAGKSTILQLICRLYPVSDGQILLNGVAIDRLTRASISQTISLVPQDAFLFSDTIAENVALGLRDFPGLEPVTEVAKSVNIDHEIQQLPERYQAYLGERGVNMSGGQKQRLTIARALIRRSPLVLLDDSLSAVDGKTEQAIVGELSAGQSRGVATGGAQAAILVSHRLATLKHASRIIVIDHGRMEAIGTHDELLASSPIYRHLHTVQASEGEAAGNELSLNVPSAGVPV